MGTAYDVCAVIIQFVYDFVRDAINQVVEAITPYAVELTSSFVTAFPLVMAQIASSVGALIEGGGCAHHRVEGITVELGA